MSLESSCWRAVLASSVLAVCCPEPWCHCSSSVGFTWLDSSYGSKWLLLWLTEKHTNPEIHWPSTSWWRHAEAQLNGLLSLISIALALLPLQMALHRLFQLSAVLRSAVSLTLRRNLGLSAVVLQRTKELDPVQKLFLDKIRDYNTKSKWVDLRPPQRCVKYWSFKLESLVKDSTQKSLENPTGWLPCRSL